MAVPLISSLNIGNFLKIVSKGMVYNNLSEDSEIWSVIKQKKRGPAEGRELRYLLRSGYGNASVGFMPLNGGSFPSGKQSNITEGVTVYKDFALTVEVERTLIAKAIQDMSRYGEPLAEELRSKTIALSRRLSYAAFQDGTGVLGEADTAGTISSGQVVLPLQSGASDRGFVGWFQLDDHVHVYTTAGVEETPTVSSGTFSYYSVESRDRDSDSVTLAARDASGAELTVTATNITVGSVIYRAQQKANGNIPDLTAAGIAAGTTDYNTLSESFVGLDTLSSNDNRLANGINHTGAFAGVIRDVGGNPIDSQDFQKVMSQVMISVGQGRYKYNDAYMAWETLDALIESREVDHRFQSIKDNKRGVESLGYQHGKNNIIFVPDEFCPKQRIYILPEGDVLQFYGSDFEFVNPDGSGQKFFLKPNGNGHDRTVRAYMEGSGALMSVHSSGIGRIQNFTV